MRALVAARTVLFPAEAASLDLPPPGTTLVARHGGHGRWFGQYSILRENRTKKYDIFWKRRPIYGPTRDQH